MKLEIIHQRLCMVIRSAYITAWKPQSYWRTLQLTHILQAKNITK